MEREPRIIDFYGGIKKEIKDTPFSFAVECISTQKKLEKEKDIWGHSKFEDIKNLCCNSSGNVGETLLESICKKTGIESSIDGTKTKKKGGGTGDGKINQKTNEIKTARLGNDSKNFQHELAEYPWKADFMTFVDVSPDSIYLTIFNNFSEDFYKISAKDKSKKCEPYFPTMTITRRKGNGNFKLNTSLQINEINVEKGYTLKITEETSFDIVKEYIIERTSIT